MDCNVLFVCCGSTDDQGSVKDEGLVHLNQVSPSVTAIYTGRRERGSHEWAIDPRAITPRVTRNVLQMNACRIG